MDVACDVLVIGSGPGGAITAYELSRAGCDVALCEEGAEIEPGTVEDFSLEDMALRYRNGGLTAALGRTPVAYAEACCLGGGSEINAGLYHRLPGSVIENWRNKYRIEDLEADGLRPHFEQCEEDLSVSIIPGAAPLSSLKLKLGAERLGWSVAEVPRWYRYASEGSARPPVRQSMSRVYLLRAREHGCRIFTCARIDRLQIRGTRAYAAVGTLCGETAPKTALRVKFEDVVICAGATGTPALLRRSGITRNVGDTLAMHPTAKMIAVFPDLVNENGAPIGMHQVREFHPRFSFGCSISSPPFLAASLLGQRQLDTAEVIQNWRRMAVYYVATSSHGRGTVRSAPWLGVPIVRYQPTLQEFAALAEGLRKLGQLLFEAGAQCVIPSVEGWGRLSKREELSALSDSLPARFADLMTIHLMGTCPMGENRDRCAADSHGKLHRYENVYINDSSLLPEAPGVNPQGGVMAIARRNALRYLGAKGN